MAVALAVALVSNAVALVSKKRSRVGSQEQSRAMEGQQEQGRMDGTRATGQQNATRLQQDPIKEAGGNPKQVEEAQPPKREQDQGHPIKRPRVGRVQV